MDFDARIEAVVRCMAKEGIEVLIACSDGLQMPDRPDPVAHLSGYRSLGESVALLHSDGASKLSVSPAAGAERVAACPGPDFSLATDDLFGALARALADRKSTGGRVAIVGIDALPHAMAERLLAI